MYKCFRSSTQPEWYPTCVVPNRVVPSPSCTQPEWYPTQVVPSPSGTQPKWYPARVVPNPASLPICTTRPKRPHWPLVPPKCPDVPCGRRTWDCRGETRGRCCDSHVTPPQTCRTQSVISERSISAHRMIMGYVSASKISYKVTWLLGHNMDSFNIFKRTSCDTMHQTIP